jgi:hypothetical protein
MNACRTGTGMSGNGITVRRSKKNSVISRPSAAYTFELCWGL